MSDNERLEEAKKIMEAFQRQTQMAANGGLPSHQQKPTESNGIDNQGGTFANPGDGNNIGMGFDNQGDQNAGVQPLINPSTPQPAPQPINQNPSPVYTPPPNDPPSMPPDNAVMSRPDVCPQCKLMHPPLRPGEKCPNAGVDSSIKTTGIDDVIINKHLVDLKNIILSQLTSKGIKDGKKFLQYSVIELTKALEQYNE